MPRGRQRRCLAVLGFAHGVWVVRPWAPGGLVQACEHVEHEGWPVWTQRSTEHHGRKQVHRLFRVWEARPCFHVQCKKKQYFFNLVFMSADVS